MAKGRREKQAAAEEGISSLHLLLPVFPLRVFFPLKQPISLD
jgi:hypothetical protein